MNDIRTLWDLLPHPSPEHIIRVFSRIGDVRAGDFARSAGELERFSRANNTKNVYLAPNPSLRTTGIRHTTSDVTHWSWFFIDIDPVEEEYSSLEVAAEALELFGEWMGIDFIARKPLVIDSGRGHQIWIRLEDIIFDDLDPVTDIAYGKTTNGIFFHEGRPISLRRKTASRIMKYWLEKLDKELGVVSGCRIDTSCSDLPRLMRMPGTINQKTGRETKLLVPSPVVYTGLAYKMSFVPERVLNEPEKTGVASGSPWQVAFSHLTLKAQNYLLKGKAEPARHETAWHTLTKLKECGIGIDQATLAVYHANRLAGEEQELSKKDVDVILKQVYETA